MSRFLISYDLHAPEQNYDDTHKILKRLGAKWILGSTWLLKKASTSKDIRDALEDALDNDDSIVVVEFDDYSARGLPFKLKTL